MKTGYGNLLNQTDMSADCVSLGVRVDGATHLSIQTVFTGAPVGTFILQTSDDDVEQPSKATHWTNATSGTAISAAGDHTVNHSGIAAKFARLKYVFTSGTGTITSCRSTAKGPS